MDVYILGKKINCLYIYLAMSKFTHIHNTTIKGKHVIFLHWRHILYTSLSTYTRKCTSIFPRHVSIYQLRWLFVMSLQLASATLSSLSVADHVRLSLRSVTHHTLPALWEYHHTNLRQHHTSSHRHHHQPSAIRRCQPHSC